MLRVPANEILYKFNKGFKQVFVNGWKVISDVEIGKTQFFVWVVHLNANAIIHK